MLNNIGLPGLLLIAIVVLVLFGRGKISGMMGEVVGIAAALCTQYDTPPRGLYENHLSALTEALQKGVPASH